MFSRFFIDRPIFATVIAILMVLVGLVVLKSLPIAQFPDITPPTVSVSATYPGADAETVAQVVGVPIEQQVNGVEGMMYMSSTSSQDGTYSLTVTFNIGTNLDDAAVKIQNRVALAEATLPAAVKQQGISVRSEASNILMFLTLNGDDSGRYDDLYLGNYAQLNITDELSRIDGVGQADAWGSGQYSMRVWLDPDKMRIRGLTSSDVMQVIQSQNIQVSAGNVGSEPTDQDVAFEFTLTSEGRLKTAEEFGNIVVRTGDNGELLRLRDIGTVELGSTNYSTVSSVDGHAAGMIAIMQRPGANALEVSKAVKERMDELAKYFPPGVTYDVMMDTTEFVSASIDEVFVTFIETTAIVMIVILMFLQSWRAVIIPMLTIPVSLIATFIVMKLLGFTLNTLSLFGLVLAIAIVVDDAIVVVEDCARLVQEGKLTPRQSAEKAMTELTGPVVGEVLVLLSVFIPTAFISGIAGELYKQFALTIAVSTAFSGFNALTFTPAMCALFLKKQKPHTFFLYKWFNIGWGHTVNVYMKAVGALLRKPWMAIGLYVLLTVIAFYGFIKWPSSYVPSEDQGYFITSIQLPTGASLERTKAVMAELTKEILDIPVVKHVGGAAGMSFLGGGNGSNLGTMFVVLKPWKDRKKKDQSVDGVIKRIDEAAARIQEAIIFSINPPAIPGLGMSSGLEMQLLDINNYGAQEMGKALDEVRAEAAKDPRIASTTSLYEGSVPQYRLKIDRDRVKFQQIALEDIYTTLSDFMGAAYVNDFQRFGRVYQVTMAGEAGSRKNVEDVLKLSVRNAQGQMVPFGAFTTIEPTSGQSNVSRYNMYSTAALTATPAHGTSSGEGIKIMEELLRKTLGNSYSYAWTGQAYQESQGGTTIEITLIFAVIITILVLAAQYESWTDPIAVVISMPMAILGTIIGCIFMKQSVSIYTQVGIILLLGLAAKNAILIVEYAVDFRKAGLTIRQAATQGGKIRFRPIMMTACAFVFGVMPMMFASGAGAASRISLGTAVVFGMAVNAIVGTLFVPGFWEMLQTFQEKYLDKMFASADAAPVSEGNENEAKDIAEV